mgnify:CR=1 FL=1
MKRIIQMEIMAIILSLAIIGCQNSQNHSTISINVALEDGAMNQKDAIKEYMDDIVK